MLERGASGTPLNSLNPDREFRDFAVSEGMGYGHRIDAP